MLCLETGEGWPRSGLQLTSTGKYRYNGQGLEKNPDVFAILTLSAGREMTGALRRGVP